MSHRLIWHLHGPHDLLHVECVPAAAPGLPHGAAGALGVHPGGAAHLHHVTHQFGDFFCLYRVTHKSS